MTADEVMAHPIGGSPPAVKVTYSNAQTYQKAAKKLGLMDDFRVRFKKKLNYFLKDNNKLENGDWSQLRIEPTFFSLQQDVFYRRCLLKNVVFTVQRFG